MAAGDQYQKISPSDQWIIDANGSVVGIRSPHANGNDLRVDLLPYTWSNKPASANLFERIRITDFGVPGIVMVWDGSRWVADGPQLLARSGVAVSLTGTLTETALATVTIPAGAMGLNGGLEIRSTWSCTNSANTKTLRDRLGGIAGGQIAGIALTTTAVFADFRWARNRGSAASQALSQANSAASPFGATGATSVSTAIDTSVSQDLVLSGQLTNTGETITLENYEVRLTA